MPHYKFSDLAYNITDKKMPEPGDERTYIGLEHLDSGSLAVTHWGGEIELKGQKLVMKKGDILFGRRNTYLRRAAIAPHDGIFSAHGMIFRPKTDVIDPDYFPFFIASDYFMNAAIRISVGSLSPTVNWKTLKELKFDIPTLEQQRESAKILKAANELKESYQALLSKTDDLVKSQFIELFSVEKGWPIAKLEELCDSIVRGPFGSALKVSFFVDKGSDTVKVYEQKNAIQRSAILGDSYVTQEKYNELKRFECGPGDFIMSCSGTIGCLYQLPDDAEPGIINQALCKFHLNGKMLPEVFLTYMRNSVDQLETKGSAIKNIGAVSFIKNMEIALPPIEEQEAFAEFIRQSDKSKFELKQAIEGVDILIKSMIQQELN